MINEKSEHDSEAIECEFNRLSYLINATPKVSRESIKRYHEPIILELDSGKIIPVLSSAHRILHELIWKKTFEIVNGCSDLNSSALCFVFGINCNSPSNLCSYKLYLGGAKSERERFDIWYAQAYKKINVDFGNAVIKDATKTARNTFGCKLEEVIIKLD